MGLMNYKMQKIMLFGLAAYIPGMVFVLFGLIGLDIILSMIFMLLTGTLFLAVGHIATSQNPFVKAIQEGKVLICDVPSTGICNIYTADVIETDMNGIDIKMETGETRAYDRSVTSLLTQPQRAIMRFLKNKENPMESKIKIELSNDEYKNAAWKYDQMTILFYNSQTGTFITKPLMSQQEKDLLAEYLSLNEARELRHLNNALLSLMRYTFDLIGDRISKLFGNPVFQIALVVMLIIVIGYAAFQFMPGLSGAAEGAVGGITGVAEPISNVAGGLP